MDVGRSLRKAGYENIVLGRSGRDGGLSSHEGRFGDKPEFFTPDYFYLNEFRKKMNFKERIENAKTKEEAEEIIKERTRTYYITKGAHFGGNHRIADSLGKVTYKGSSRGPAKSWNLIEGDVGEISGNTAVVHTYKAMGKYVGEYIVSEAQKKEREVSGGLEKTVATVSVVSSIGGVFLLSSNITGNVIANVSQNSSNIFGVVLLVAGLVAGFFWVKSRNK